MNSQDIKKYEEMLLKRKADLEKDLTVTPLVTEMGVDTEGEIREEEADEAEEMTTNYALRQNLREELGEIVQALEKIRQNTYGKCDKCGGEIAREILEVAPESLLCGNCKVSA